MLLALLSAGVKDLGAEATELMHKPSPRAMKDAAVQHTSAQLAEPGSAAREQFRRENVVKVLEVSAVRRFPKTIRVDNDPSSSRSQWTCLAYFKKVKLDCSRPCKPTGNAFTESFNGKFRTGVELRRFEPLREVSHDRASCPRSMSTSVSRPGPCSTRICESDARGTKRD